MVFVTFLYWGYKKHSKTRGFLYLVAQEALQTGPRQPKSAPRGPQDGPRGHQDGLRSPQDGPRSSQEGSKRYPRPADLSPRAPQGPPRRPREPPRGPRRAPIIPQEKSQRSPKRPLPRSTQRHQCFLAVQASSGQTHMNIWRCIDIVSVRGPAAEAQP